MRPTLISSILLVGGLLLGLLIWRQDLDGLDEEQQVIRVMRWHGHFCHAKIASLTSDGTMRGVCADGKFYYRRQPSDDESLLCRLGADVSCWDATEGW